jgi:hypothetical protein
MSLNIKLVNLIKDSYYISFIYLFIYLIKLIGNTLIFYEREFKFYNIGYVISHRYI